MRFRPKRCSRCSLFTNRNGICNNCEVSNENHRVLRIRFRPKRCSRCASFTNTKGVCSKCEVSKENHDVINIPLEKCYCRECKRRIAEGSICAICSTDSNQYPLKSRLHKFYIGGVKCFKCNRCSYRCKGKGTLRMHILNHTCEKPYYCEQCDSEFLTERTYDLHRIREHIKEKPLYCFKCNSTCFEWSEFKEHQDMHVRGCKVYNYVRSELKSLPTLTIKLRRLSPVFYCFSCDFMCLKSSVLVEHQKTHQNICKICDFQCISNKVMEQHKLIHINQPSSNNALRQLHYRDYCAKLKRIDNFFMFRCDYCELTCDSAANMQEHEKLHSNNKLVTCDICDSRFITKRRLKRHKLTHTLEKLFYCSKCSFMSNSKDDLFVHEQMKHPHNKESLSLNDKVLKLNCFKDYNANTIEIQC